MENELDAIDPMDKCETVKIVTKEGYAIINESDFDEKTMKLFAEKEAKKGNKDA